MCSIARTKNESHLDFGDTIAKMPTLGAAFHHHQEDGVSSEQGRATWGKLLVTRAHALEGLEPSYRIQLRRQCKSCWSTPASISEAVSFTGLAILPATPRGQYNTFKANVRTDLASEERTWPPCLRDTDASQDSRHHIS